MKTYEEKLQEAIDVLNKPMREQMQKWLDIANGLPSYKEVKGSLRPELRSRTLELVKQWEEEKKKREVSDEC